MPRIDPKDIQAAYLGTYMPGPSGGKSAVSLGDALRLYDRPITRVENYCATGTDAFRNACLAVASGIYDIVLVARRREAQGPRRARPAALRPSAVGEGQLGARPLRAGGEPLHAHVRRRPRDAGQDRGEEPLQRGAQSEGAPAHGDHRGQGTECADDLLPIRSVRLLPDHRRRRRRHRLPRRAGAPFHRPSGAGEGLRAGGDHRPAVLRSDLRLPRLPLDPARGAAGVCDGRHHAAGHRLRRGARLLHLDRAVQHRRPRLLRQGRRAGVGARGAHRAATATSRSIRAAASSRSAIRSAPAACA